MRDSCIFYRSFYESINELPDSNKLEIYNAIFSYSLNFIEPELTGLSKSIFTLIKPQLDANIKRFNNGNIPKKKQNRSKTEAKQKQKTSKNGANNNDNKNKNDNNNLNDNKNNNIGDSPKTPLELKFDEYLKFRKAKKVPVLPESLQSLKNKLWKLSGQNVDTAIKILDESISNGWTGIFKINEQNGKQSVITNNQSVRDKVLTDAFNELSSRYSETQP